MSDAPPPVRRTGAALFRFGFAIVDFVGAAAFFYLQPGPQGQLAALVLATLGVFYLIRGVLVLRM